MILRVCISVFRLVETKQLYIFLLHSIMSFSRIRRLIPVLLLLLLSTSGSDLVWPFNNELLVQDWEGETGLSV